MANNCFYTMNAVAKDKAVLERLLDIMNYRDNEYCIYRCFSADMVGETEEDGFYRMEISGYVAWSCTHWFDHEEELGNKGSTGAHYVTLDILCRKLGIGIELFSEECGCQFQEHYMVDHNGNVLWNERVEWTQEWEDEDGNELDEPIETGGFDYYCQFDDSACIYGEEEEPPMELWEIQETAGMVSRKLCKKYNLEHADKLGEQLTDKDEFEDGYVRLTLWDTSREYEANGDRLNMEMYFQKDGSVKIACYTYGDGKKVGVDGLAIDEGLLDSMVAYYLKEWRSKFLP